MRYLLLIFTIGVSSFLFSQNFAFDIENQKTEVEDNSFNAQWAGMEIGFISTNRTDEWQNLFLQSVVFNFNVIEYKLPIFKQYLGLTTGLGFNTRQYSFTTDYSLVSTNGITSLQTGNPHLYDSMASVKRSQFNLGYVQVPLLLDFATKQRGKGSFYIAAGVIGGIRLYGNHTLEGTYSNQDKFRQVIRNKGAFNANLFTADATVRIGYSGLGIFGNYSLLSMFKKDSAPSIAPFTVGISLNFDYGSDEKSDESEKEEDFNIDF